MEQQFMRRLHCASLCTVLLLLAPTIGVTQEPSPPTAQDSAADTAQHWTWKAPAFTQKEIEKAIADTISKAVARDRDCRDVSQKRLKEMAHYRFPADTATMLLCGKIWIGMSARLLSWAMPVYDSKNATETANGTSIQWVYRESRARHVYGHPHASAVYVYVERDVVSAIQFDE